MNNTIQCGECGKVVKFSSFTAHLKSQKHRLTVERNNATHSDNSDDELNRLRAQVAQLEQKNKTLSFENEILKNNNFNLSCDLEDFNYLRSFEELKKQIKLITGSDKSYEMGHHLLLRVVETREYIHRIMTQPHIMAMIRRVKAMPLINDGKYPDNHLTSFNQLRMLRNDLAHHNFDYHDLDSESESILTHRSV